VSALGLLVVVAACVSERADVTSPPTVPPVDPNDPAFGRSAHVVAVNGSSGNTGDLIAPWDLATALSGASGRVTPGDTVWIRGGTYRGAFTSRLEGTPGLPVLVRAQPAERVIIEHAGGAVTTLSVQGDWSIFWGLEITNGSSARATTSTASEQRPNGIANHASHTRFVNLVVHDAGVGLYSAREAFDVEVVGSIFYNNGWQAPDRGHGHALYVKSDAGPLTLRRNVIFNQFGWGIHVYTNEGSGGLTGISVLENLTFNNGTLAQSPNAQNILVGGEEPASRIRLEGNVAWQHAGVPGTNVALGYGTTENDDVVVVENRFVGGDPVLRVGDWSSAHLLRNTLVGTQRMVELDDATATGYVWDATRQVRDPLSLSWRFGGTDLPFAVWSVATGLGATDLVGGAPPPAEDVVVLRDLNEPGRTFIAVLNWSGAAVVNVSLDGILLPGESYDLYNVQALHGAPIASGIFAGSIPVPMGGVAPPVPVGLSASRAPRTAPAFDVFLIRRQ
jgi:hypothetical protein